MPDAALLSFFSEAELLLSDLDSADFEASLELDFVVVWVADCVVD